MFDVNEYVNVDVVRKLGNAFWITYEPTEYRFNKIHGTIYFERDRDPIGFRQGNHNLLVDCNDVLNGIVQGSVIIFVGAPSWHYLTVSYENSDKCDPFKPNWRKEGF